MTTSTLSIAAFTAIVPFLPAHISVMTKGNHGIGKSDLAKLIAHIIRTEVLGGKYKFPVIDRRMSQQTDGDLMGLPSIDDDSTRFNPPDWYKQACDEPVFLFLDEFNRASRETMQGAFQIVLDRELNGRKLHPETRIMTAINAAAHYDVEEIDPALLDRFWVVNINPTVEDWIHWAESAPLQDDFRTNIGLRTNVVPLVSDFIRSEEGKNWLDSREDVNLSDTQPSRRSWDRLSMSLVMSKVKNKEGKHVSLLDNVESSSFYDLCAGFVGTEAASKFWAFSKDVESRISGEEIVERFSKAEKKLKKLPNEALNGAIDLVQKYIFENIKQLNDTQGKNVKQFMQLLPDELKLSMWSKLTEQGYDALPLIRSLHVHVIADLLKVFDIVPGPEGRGLVANYPGMVKKDDKAMAVQK